MIEIVAATREHAEAMAPHMRREDAAEVRSVGLTPLGALLGSLDGALLAHTALIDGRPAAMWGARAESVLGEKALLWMLGTDAVPRNARLLLLWSRVFVEHMQKRYALLECFVDVRYGAALRWVAWLGFARVGIATLNGGTFAVCQRRR